jgi:hypothetical protein
MNLSIDCPKCGARIDLSKRITELVNDQSKKEAAMIIEEERKKYEKNIAEKIREAEKKAAEKARQDERAKIEDDKKTLEVENKKLKAHMERQQKEIEEKVKREAKKIASQQVEERISEIKNTHQGDMENKELRIKELTKKVKDTESKLKEAQSKLEEGSSQIRGIISEEDLFQYLKKNIPSDICQVRKIGQGKKGTDIIVNVLRDSKQLGSIIIDNKWANDWNSSWPEKVWGDMREYNAEFAYITAKPSAMPDELKDAGFGIAPCKKAGVRVWVIDRNNLPLVLGILSDSIDKIIKMAEIKAMYGTGSKSLKMFQEYLTNEYEIDLREKAKQMSTAVKSINDMYKKVQSEYTKAIDALQNYWITESKVHQSMAACFGADTIKSIPQIKELHKLT